MPFPGIIPAAITPFTADDQVDVDGLRANVGALRRRTASRGFVADRHDGRGGLAERRRARGSSSRPCVDVAAGARAGDRRRLGGLDRRARSPTPPSPARRARRRDVPAAAATTAGTQHELVAFYAAVAGRRPADDALQQPGRVGRRPLAATSSRAIAAEVPAIVARQGVLGRRAPDRRAASTTPTSTILVGGDDWALEGFATGATGWVSGVAQRRRRPSASSCRSTSRPGAWPRRASSTRGCCRWRAST